ncbi:MAG: ferredoxin [bacterium]|nr:ferredoxin [bacterium]
MNTKKLVVDKDTCIGCGMCVGIDEDHFELKDVDGASVSVPKNQDNLESTQLEDAISACPVGAIKLEEDKKEA